MAGLEGFVLYACSCDHTDAAVNHGEFCCEVSYTIVGRAGLCRAVHGEGRVGPGPAIDRCHGGSPVTGHRLYATELDYSLIIFTRESPGHIIARSSIHPRFVDSLRTQSHSRIPSACRGLGYRWGQATSRSCRVSFTRYHLVTVSYGLCCYSSSYLFERIF